MAKFDIKVVFAENLRAACARKFQREISQSELHRASGVSQKTISNIYAALRSDATEIANPNLSTIEALADTVGLHPWELLHPEAQAVPTLTENEKQLLELFRSVKLDAQGHILRTARLEASLPENQKQ